MGCNNLSERKACQMARQRIEEYYNRGELEARKRGQKVRTLVSFDGCQDFRSNMSEGWASINTKHTSTRWNHRISGCGSRPCRYRWEKTTENIALTYNFRKTDQGWEMSSLSLSGM